MKAYLIVTVASGKAPGVAREIGSMPGVLMADACWGVGDVFAVLQFPNWKEFNDVVLEKVHHIPGVSHTETHVAIETTT